MLDCGNSCFSSTPVSFNPYPGTAAEAEITVADTPQYEESCDEFVGYEDYIGPQAVGTENYAAPRAVDEGLAPSQKIEVGEVPSQRVNGVLLSGPKEVGARHSSARYRG